MPAIVILFAGMARSYRSSVIRICFSVDCSTSI